MKKTHDPNWLSGFANGEGCFSVSIYNSSTCKLGEAVVLKLQIYQHNRDSVLLSNLTTTLNCGRIEPYPNGPAVYLVVTKFKDITDKIIPFFDNFKGRKS
jgi:hypothetical protein